MVPSHALGSVPGISSAPESSWVCLWMPSRRESSRILRFKTNYKSILVQLLVDSWKISILWASAGRFSTYWGGGFMYQSAFRRSYGSIFTANVCIFHCCWMCLYESWFSVANGRAKSAARQNKNKKEKQNKHTHSCGVPVGLYIPAVNFGDSISSEVNSGFWLQIPLLSLFLSPHFSTSELLNIFTDGCLCMLSVNFSPPDAPAHWTKKKLRQTKKKTKQIFKKLNTVWIFTCGATHWNSLRSSNANQTSRIRVLTEKNKFIYTEIYMTNGNELHLFMMFFFFCWCLDAFFPSYILFSVCFFFLFFFP